MKKISDANVINVIKEITGQDITSLIVNERAEDKKEEEKEESRPPRKKEIRKGE